MPLKFQIDSLIYARMRPLFTKPSFFSNNSLQELCAQKCMLCWFGRMPWIKEQGTWLMILTQLDPLTAPCHLKSLLTHSASCFRVCDRVMHSMCFLCRIILQELCCKPLVLQKVAAFRHSSRNQSEIFRVSKFDIGPNYVKILSKSDDAIVCAGRTNLRYGF